MDTIEFKNTYWNYYKHLENELFSTAEYCSIDPYNKNAYSIKYLELYESICGEIYTLLENICLILNKESKTNTYSEYINAIVDSDYKPFLKENVIITGYKYDNIRPFIQYKNDEHILWWQKYNLIKHHRASSKNSLENYKYANQENVLTALAGLYILEQYIVFINFAGPENETQNTIIPIFRSERLMLSNWTKFYKSFMGPSIWFDTKEFYKYLKETKEVE